MIYLNNPATGSIQNITLEEMEAFVSMMNYCVEALSDDPRLSDLQRKKDLTELLIQRVVDSLKHYKHHHDSTAGLWACDADPDILEQRFIDHGGTLAQFFHDVMFRIQE